jgi:hypothetical protein
MLLVLFLAFYVPILCLPFKFGGAFFHAMPKSTRSLGIVNLVTLWAMCHFKFRGGVDFWNLFVIYVCKYFNKNIYIYISLGVF